MIWRCDAFAAEDRPIAIRLAEALEEDEKRTAHAERSRTIEVAYDEERQRRETAAARADAADAKMAADQVAIAALHAQLAAAQPPMTAAQALAVASTGGV